MGVCASSGLSEEEKRENRAAAARSKQLDQQLRKENINEQEKIKLLFLGAGESGKSTMLKQMTKIYGKGFSQEDRLTFITAVHDNAIQGMRTLCLQCKDFGFEVGADAKAGLEHFDLRDYKENEQKLDEKTAGYIATLWQDPSIRKTFSNRSRFQLFDGASYFFDNVNRIWQDDYIPTDDDILHTRVRTTGIVETHFLIEGNDFLVVDVGGQRNERKKWLHCFSEVTAVLFLAALSVYDQTLYEDEDTNRMDESLALWEQIVNSRYFENTSMILFFNKDDLFREKLPKVPLSTHFPDYKGSSYDEAVGFICEKFLSKVHQHSPKRIYPHVTNATNTENMQVVFEAVKDTIIRRSLHEGGLINDM